jgi:multidrug efflux pump subunit AcrB
MSLITPLSSLLAILTLVSMLTLLTLQTTAKQNKTLADFESRQNETLQRVEEMQARITELSGLVTVSLMILLNLLIMLIF